MHRAAARVAPRVALMACWISDFRHPGSARIGTNPEQLFAAAWSASLKVPSCWPLTKQKSRRRLV